MDASARDRAMKQLLSSTASPDSPLWATLEDLAFVPTASGALFKASQLFDSRKRHLEVLVGKADSFPAAHFADSEQVWRSVQELTAHYYIA